MTRHIETLIAERYGVDALSCDAIVIEWAAERIASTHGAGIAAKQWKRINARRYRMGRYTTIPGYGTALFEAYFDARRP